MASRIYLFIIALSIVSFSSCDRSVDPSVQGCTNKDACNYNSLADKDDESCLAFDQCGVCGGSGIPDSACDCSGNILDCQGECGGLASTDECGECDSDPSNNCTQDCLGAWGGSTMVDLCGICNGDNGTCSGCMNSDANNYDESATIDDGSCIVLGCTDPSASNFNQAATDDDGSCLYGDCVGYDVCLGIENVDLDTGTLDIVLHSNVDVSGFQFDIGDWDYEGAWNQNDLSISSVYNGVATDEGFSITSSSSRVIGFSLSGSVIPSGSHTLLSIGFSNFSNSICISSPIFSDTSANALTVSSGQCYPQSITGESQLILIKDTVSSLESDDIVYIYDNQGLINYGSCSSEIGRVLVAVGVWTAGQQLELSAVGSIDLCSLGGMQFPGFISGNSIEIEVQREDVTFSASDIVLEAGSGKFGDIMTVISEIYIN